MGEAVDIGLIPRVGPRPRALSIALPNIRSVMEVGPHGAGAGGGFRGPGVCCAGGANADGPMLGNCSGKLLTVVLSRRVGRLSLLSSLYRVSSSAHDVAQFPVVGGPDPQFPPLS